MTHVFHDLRTPEGVRAMKADRIIRVREKAAERSARKFSMFPAVESTAKLVQTFTIQKGL